MPVQATVILDSGCILPGDENSNSTDIGYFQSDALAPDIRVVADGIAYPDAALESLGQNCVIEIRHVKSDGTINTGGARAANGFHDDILHLRDLYGVDMPVSAKNFDCVLRFDAGLFCSAQVKPRQFKVYRENNGQYLYSATDAPLAVDRPIAHNIHVLFKLDDGDKLELARDGVVFWSSSRLTFAHRLEVEFIADNSTAEKFYRDALTGLGDRCYLPNQGDPPPVCPQDPCRPPSGGTL
jgi:hypothetical protein